MLEQPTDSAHVWVYDVAITTLYPVVARPGEVIVARTGECESVVVVARGTTRVLRVGAADTAALQTLVADGVIVRREPRPKR